MKPLNLQYKVRRGFRILCNIAGNLSEPPIMVLTYHRIVELKDDRYQLAVSPEHFGEQLEFLSHRFPILRFDDSWRRPAEPSFVITFDDGYEDNLRNALPILREFRVPATFFICAGAVDSNQEFPWDGGKVPQRHAYRTLRHSELMELAADPLVSIGSHTLTHARLSALPTAVQKYEIEEGHKKLEQLLGKKLSVFSYPFGNYMDFSQKTMNLCREAGFFRVAANYSGQYHWYCNEMAVPRHLVRDWNKIEFERRLFRFKYL